MPAIDPQQFLAATLRQLGGAVVTRGLLGLLAGVLVQRITDRLRDINHRFARLAASLAAGTWRPRRVGMRRASPPGKPRPPNPLPRNFGWLWPLAPDPLGARGAASQLENLFRQPEMQALMAAAPAPMARVLRPLCWMLRVRPPPILARPRRPAVPAQEAAPPPNSAPPNAAQPDPPPPSPPPPARRPARPPPRACGPPRPA